MGDDFDKAEWQEQEKARQKAIELQRKKDKKTRERAARNAKRKLERLRKTLSENGDLSDWEDEFSESVSERLDKYGSAFHDREKGRSGDALSFAQRRVMNALNKKAKDKKRKIGQQKTSSFSKRRGGFKQKNPKFKPRIRQLDEEFEADETSQIDRELEPYIPTPPSVSDAPMKKRPFLRVVKNKDKT